MSRKPYRAQLSCDWFIKTPHFLKYMIREFTCIGIGLYVLNLMAGIIALAVSEDSWKYWIMSQRNPVMIIISIFAFISAIYHTYTWFGVTPKVFKIQKGDKFIPGKWVITAHWCIFTIIGIFLLLIA